MSSIWAQMQAELTKAQEEEAAAVSPTLDCQQGQFVDDVHEHSDAEAEVAMESIQALSFNAPEFLPETTAQPSIIEQTASSTLNEEGAGDVLQAEASTIKLPAENLACDNEQSGLEGAEMGVLEANEQLGLEGAEVGALESNEQLGLEGAEMGAPEADFLHFQGQEHYEGGESSSYGQLHPEDMDYESAYSSMNSYSGQVASLLAAAASNNLPTDIYSLAVGGPPNLGHASSSNHTDVGPSKSSLADHNQFPSLSVGEGVNRNGASNVEGAVQSESRQNDPMQNILKDAVRDAKGRVKLVWSGGTGASRPSSWASSGTSAAHSATINSSQFSGVDGGGGDDLVRAPRVETGDSVNHEFMSQREDAMVHARKRNKYFEEATRAYRAGDGARAKRMSELGRHHDAMMRKLHEDASQQIFQSRNVHLDRGVVDLHGLHVDEAILILQEQCSTRATPFTVITGTGHHSVGSHAKVRPAAMAWLKQNRLQYKEVEWGQLRVNPR